MVDGLINFNQYEVTTPIIKVIGVGGGGGNAVEYMYRQGICDVDFVLCNTDSQALNQSPIKTRIQLGTELRCRHPKNDKKQSDQYHNELPRSPLRRLQWHQRCQQFRIPEFCYCLLLAYPSYHVKYD